MNQRALRHMKLNKEKMRSSRFERVGREAFKRGNRVKEGKITGVSKANYVNGSESVFFELFCSFSAPTNTGCKPHALQAHITHFGFVCMWCSCSHKLANCDCGNGRSTKWKHTHKHGPQKCVHLIHAEVCASCSIRNAAFSSLARKF